MQEELAAQVCAGSHSTSLKYGLLVVSAEGCWSLNMFVYIQVLDTEALDIFLRRVHALVSL